MCEQFLNPMEILLMHPIRIGNITSVSTFHLMHMDNRTMDYFFWDKHNQRDIRIDMGDVIPTPRANICEQY